ncbi:ABC transporter ATP-binding protein [Bordetella sp. 2513F-2]
MAPTVTLQGVAKSFGRHTVLHGLDLAIGPGEIVGLLGPNGSGKTTTLRLIAGVYAPERGCVHVCGEPPPAGRGSARIGYLPERVPLYDALTVTQYLDYVAHLKVAGGWRVRRRAVQQALSDFGLGGVAGKAIGRLSKGFRQRVGLAQAVLNDPPVLLLDEATNGLDPLQIVEVRQLIRRCAQGRAVLFSSHLMQEVEALCTRIAILRDGRLIEDTTLAPPQAAGVRLVLRLQPGAGPALDGALQACPAIRQARREALPQDGLSACDLVLADMGDGLDAALRAVLPHAQVLDLSRGAGGVEARLLAAVRAADAARAAQEGRP